MVDDIRIFVELGVPYAGCDGITYAKDGITVGTAKIQRRVLVNASLPADMQSYTWVDVPVVWETKEEATKRTGVEFVECSNNI